MSQSKEEADKMEAAARKQVYDIADKYGYQVETDNDGQLVLYTAVHHEDYEYCPECHGFDGGMDCDNEECNEGIVFIGGE